MQILRIISLALPLACIVSATSHSKTNSQNQTRYAILDNDWSAAGFIPYLMALDAGIEILAVTSCRFPKEICHVPLTKPLSNCKHMAKAMRIPCSRNP